MLDRAEEKSALIAIACLTDAGMLATPEQALAIETASNRLESQNPNPRPTDRLDLIARRWKLIYTNTNLEKQTTLYRLAFGQLPQIEAIVNELYQEIKQEDRSHSNLIEFTVSPALHGVLSIGGNFEVLSPTRLQINFNRILVSPQPETDREIWRKALGISDSQTFNLEARIKFEGWNEITYLDEDLRLVRGNAGHLYILVPDN